MAAKNKAELLTLADQHEAEEALADIGCSLAGISIMKAKAVFRVVRLHNVSTKAANIIKQSFLSKGAEAAVSRNAADLSAPVTDVILMGTLHQYRLALSGFEHQPWGLPALALEIKALLSQQE